MQPPSKVQGGGQKLLKTAFFCAPRAFAHAARAQSKIRQSHSVRISILPTHANFRKNLPDFATTYLQKTRTEAITLRKPDPLNH